MRRPAAMEQLAVLGKEAGVDTLPILPGQAPADIALPIAIALAVSVIGWRISKPSHNHVICLNDDLQNVKIAEGETYEVNPRSCQEWPETVVGGGGPLLFSYK